MTGSLNTREGESEELNDGRVWRQTDGKANLPAYAAEENELGRDRTGSTAPERV